MQQAFSVPFYAFLGFSGAEVARSAHNRKVLSSNRAIISVIEALSEADQSPSYGRSFVVVGMFAAVYPWRVSLGLEFAVASSSHSSRGVAIGTGSLCHKQRAFLQQT